MWTASGTSVYADGRRVWTWDTENLFDVGWDLNPLAMQIGAGADGVRDSLSAARDAFMQPLASQYRFQVYPASGYTGHAPEDDYSLYLNQDFETWVRTGQVPVPQAQIEAYQGAALNEFRAAVIANPSIAPNVINDSGGVEGTDSILWDYLKNHYGVSELPVGTTIQPIIPMPSRDDATLYADVQVSGAPNTGGRRVGSAVPTDSGSGLMYSSASGGGSGKSWLLLAVIGFAIYKLSKG
jgi:hypothetical protein